MSNHQLCEDPPGQNDPREPELEITSHARYWSNFSRKKLASYILTCHGDNFRTTAVVGSQSILPSQRYVESVLASLSWLKTSTQYYGAYFGCGKFTTWEENIESLFNDLHALIDNILCENFDWCGIGAEECTLKRTGLCNCVLQRGLRKLLPSSSKVFALQL